EVNEGRGSPHGGVFLDIASQRSPDEIKRKLPSMYHQFKQLADVDITTDPMEVGPTCHYTMGGVRVHPETQETSIPGLFAAGEVAAGLHGANRLGGNSLSDLLVFGNRAGQYAAEFAAKESTPALDDAQLEKHVKGALDPFERPDGENPYVLHEELRKMMQRKVGIVRAEDELKSAIEDIQKLRERARNVGITGNIQYNPGWHLALDLWNMLDISEVVARAALTRQESRGGHTREDFPESDKEHWGKVNLVATQHEGSIVIREEPLPEMPEELRAIIDGKVEVHA
ncbi:MAG: FAD-binding protein, partial [Candidatus Hydrogenedentales bacterium]